MDTSQSSWGTIVGRLLRPALAFAFRHSVKLKELLEQMKAVLVDIAQEDLVRRGEEISVSRISLMTGVHRKDVTELLQSKAPRVTESDVVQKIIGQWKTDKRFCSSKQPKPLSFKGQSSEFAQLVNEVQSELNTYSVLFALRQMSAVEERDGFLHLLRDEYVPIGELQERFGLVERDLHDLVRAAEENILEPRETPNLHLSTYYDNIAPEALDKIRQWFMKEGAFLHKRARQFLSKFDRDINPALERSSSAGRVVIGTFSLTEEIQKNYTAGKSLSQLKDGE